MSGAVLRGRAGTTIPLDLARWRAPADEAECALLAGLPGSVLDIGCGPGRMVEAAARHGHRALGIDLSAGAVREATARGVAVLQRSVFDPLPGEGRWGTALLLDGNIGIGGDPAALLRRVAELLRPGGVLVADVEPPGVPTRSDDVRVEVDDGTGGDGGGGAGPWFPWARVGADHIGVLLAEAGLVPDRIEPRRGRWMARGVHP